MDLWMDQVKMQLWNSAGLASLLQKLNKKADGDHRNEWWVESGNAEIYSAEMDESSYGI